MQRVAKVDKKYVPSIYEIEKIIPIDMICQDCGRKMHWIDNDNRASGAVLQHYRDGTLGIVCMSCNSKHGLMVGDSYRDLPNGHKLCTKCKTIKPLSEFGKRGKGDGNYPKSSCKVCAHKQLVAWRERNMEKYIANNKKHNDARKSNPEKYRELDRKYYWKRKEQNGKD
jgi:DNA-directed RNA polymerase subunit RPC12/RpoP